MNEAVVILSDHVVFFLLLAIMIAIGILSACRHRISGMADPVVFSILTQISPGISGFLVLLFYSQQINFYKSILFLLCTFVFFSAFSISKKKRTEPIQFVGIASLREWQFLLIITVTAIHVLNISINANFNSQDPSLRFAEIQVPFLSYLAIATLPYIMIITCITKHSTIQKIGFLAFTVCFLAEMFAAKSKIFWITLLQFYLFWLFTKRDLSLKSFLSTLARFKLKLQYFWLMILTVISLILVTLQAAIRGPDSLYGLFIRLALAFDSPILFASIDKITIGNYSMINMTGMLELWFKPFIKNLFGKSYNFENISQYLTYAATGYRATSYKTSGWQPNNNLIVDLLIFHDAFLALFFSLLIGFGLGILNGKMKKGKIGALIFPIFASAILAPFGFFIDTQLTVITVLLGFSFTIIISFFILILRIAYRQIREVNGAGNTY